MPFFINKRSESQKRIDTSSHKYLFTIRSMGGDVSRAIPSFSDYASRYWKRLFVGLSNSRLEGIQSWDGFGLLELQQLLSSKTLGTRAR
jgi:hypothetical protein